jgi:hypothetical protein
VRKVMAMALECVHVVRMSTSSRITWLARKVMGVAPTPKAGEEAAASGAMALKYSVLQV